MLIKSKPRGKCSGSDCDCEDYFSNPTDGAETCWTCKHNSEDHRLLLTDGRFCAEREAEFKQLEMVLDTTHKKNWGGRDSKHGNGSLSWYLQTVLQLKKLSGTREFRR